MSDAPIILLHPRDNVGLCLAAVTDDEHTSVGVRATEPIAAGHKMAVAPIKAGATVTKYGHVIGVATQDIPLGSHVHTHNVSADVGTAARANALASKSVLEPRNASFMGFVRPNGGVGTRNYIGILTSVNCSATVARAIADSFPASMFIGDCSVDGVVAFTHTTGCGMSSSGEGFDILRRTLDGYLRHPNFAGVLVIGLGCEVMQVSRLSESDQDAPSGVDVQSLSIQDAGGTLKAIEAGRAIVKQMLSQAGALRREECSAEHLVLGLQCGGSDGWSGITANPALGRAADVLVAAGGTVILSETPEIYGAEQLLMARTARETVKQALQDRLAWWQDYVARHGAELNNNPSPGNIAGGLTTILEKSLGAVAKSGSSPLREVVLYGDRIHQRGLVFMDSPGYDPCSATGQMASGANLLAFTTGRGSVFGSRPAPCIKLSSNEAVARHMAEDIDIDCSPVLAGRSIDEMGAKIFDLLLRTASGEKSKSEALGLGDLEFVPWQVGAVV